MLSDFMRRNMRSRPGESPQNAGRRFERLFGKLLGVAPQRGSGNRWYSKLDVADGTITFSLKWTTKPSISITKELLREADNAVYENGDNSVPAIAVSIDNGVDTIIAMRASDFMRILGSSTALYIPPTRGEQKRKRAAVPGILRDSEDDDV